MTSLATLQDKIRAHTHEWCPSLTVANPETRLRTCHDATTTETTRVRRIRLSVSSIQKKTLESWRHASRYSYNRAVWLMNDCTSYMSKLDLRNLITPAEVNQSTLWVLETPKMMREAAVFQARANRDTCFTNLRDQNIRYFRHRYMSVKAKKWTIGGISSVSISKINTRCFELCPKRNFGRVKTHEDIPGDLKDSTYSVHFDGKHYYLQVPIKVVTTRPVSLQRCTGMDPGVRAFGTFYDAETITKVGLDAYKTMTPGRQDELHWKTAHWLCTTYAKVVLPRFNTQDQVKKRRRRFHKSTVKNMTTLSHGKFLARLKTKAEQFGTDLVIIDEAYTTRTCGICAHVQSDIGARTIWTCSQCLSTHDRDANAARNIYLLGT